MLNVVVGIIFILLLLSLFATTVMEIFSALFGLRGRNLKFALKKMLADTGDEEVFNQFKESALYKQLSSKWLGTYYPPSYLSSNNFSFILSNIIENLDGEKLHDKINNIQDERLRTVLHQLVENTDKNTQEFRDKLEHWFDDIMDRASGWFKRYVQLYLIVIGFAIAVGFNADAVQIFRQLQNDPTARLEVYKAAQSFIALQSDSLVQNNALVADPNSPLIQSIGDLNNLIANDIEAIKNPLGLGWSSFAEEENTDLQFWLFKILGWLVTALAISLGAPFWFDLLRKLVNIRSSGNVPSSSNSTTVINQVPTVTVPDSGRIEIN